MVFTLTLAILIAASRIICGAYEAEAWSGAMRGQGGGYFTGTLEAIPWNAAVAWTMVYFYVMLMLYLHVIFS